MTEGTAQQPWLDEWCIRYMPSEPGQHHSRSSVREAAEAVEAFAQAAGARFWEAKQETLQKAAAADHDVSEAWEAGSAAAESSSLGSSSYRFRRAAAAGESPGRWARAWEAEAGGFGHDAVAE